MTTPLDASVREVSLVEPSSSGRAPSSTLFGSRSRRLAALPVSDRILVSSLVVTIIAWEALGQARLSVALPPFSAVVGAWAWLVGSGILFNALLASLQAFAIGFATAAILGICLGLAMARNYLLERVLNLHFNILMAVPTIALIPMLMVWFGFGLTTRAVVVFLSVLFPVAINTLAGGKGIDPATVEMARSYEATERQTFLKVILPAALPMIFAGLRLGVVRGVKGMVTAEMLTTLVGLGSLISIFGRSYRADALYAVILSLVVLAVAAALFVGWIDRRLTGWKPDVKRG